MQSQLKRYALISLLSAICIVNLTGCNSDNNQIKQPPPKQPSPSPASNWFTLAVLPDTQKYSRYSPERFYAQTQWIANHFTQEKIRFTAHLGDIVDIPNDAAEWQVARNAMEYLEQGGTPYSILAGNHDVLNSRQIDDERNDSQEPFLKYFPPSRQKNIFPDNYLGSNSHNYNSYYQFTSGDGQKFLVFALDWKVSAANDSSSNTSSTDTKTLVWVNQVLKAHPNLPAIITTHKSLNIDADGKTAVFTDRGRTLWNDVIRDNDQVILVINGHHHGEAVMEAYNKYGHKVVMEVVNYQCSYFGGDGMMQLIQFDKDNNKLHFRSYSPYVDALPADKRGKDEEIRRWEFSVDMNFAQRLSNFNPTPPEQGNIKGTRAYWILDRKHIVGDKIEQVMDVSGNSNDMKLNHTGNSAASLPDYIEIKSDSKPPFGYASGYLHFNGDKHRKTNYYLNSTAHNIKIQTSPTSQKAGYMSEYTVEAIFRLPEDWTAPRAAAVWDGLFYSIASISEVCKTHGLSCSGHNYAPFLGISKRRQELQWISVSENGKQPDNWSWNLEKGKWYHVVIVNDGQYATMYVNGMITMRTHEHKQKGMLVNKDKDWRVGPFYGDIAEVRVVNRALKKEEWLNQHDNP